MKKITNNYISDSRAYREFTQYVISKQDFRGHYNGANGYDNIDNWRYQLSAFNVVRYKTKIEWFYLSSTTTQDYGTDNSNPIVTTINYYYDNKDHTFLTRTETINSKGETLKEVSKYVGDESSIANLTTNESTAISLLKTQYRIGTLLEKEQYRNTTLLSRNRTGFRDWGNNIILPESMRIQVGNGPLETRLNYLGYDTRGNLTHFSKEDNVVTSYIWGYDNRFPIAEVKNATIISTSQTSQVATISGSNLPPTTSRYISTSNGFSLSQAQPVQFTITVSATKPSNISSLNLLVMKGSATMATIPLTTFLTVNNAMLNLPAGNYNLNYSLILNEPSVDIPTLSLTVQVTGQTSNVNVYHTSFETEFPTLNGITAKTGKNCFYGVFSLPVPPRAGKYILSFWQKANETSPWTYSEQIINQAADATPTTPALQVGNGGYLDEVRLYPVGALMTTFTFDPVIGMTSATDANNVNVTYVYDAFQRLQFLRDQDGRIIKSYEYHYADH